MKKSLGVVLLLTIVFSIKSSSQTFDSLSLFYPLQVGNVWQYDWQNLTSNPPSHLYYQTNEVLFDTIMSNGLKYFAIKNSRSSSYNYLRVDSINSTVCSWLNPTLELTLYNLKLTANTDTVFGIPTKVITTGVTENYLGVAYGFGMIWQQDYSGGFPYRSKLIYAKINGKKFGTLLGISSNENIHHLRYELFQNYPNPFNPSTTIGYSLTKSCFVNLKIYNLVGEEVETIISEQQLAGKHEVLFNANQLSSGVYIYRLIVDNNIESKLMLLLK